MEHQQLKVKFGHGQLISGEGVTAASLSSTIILRSSFDSLPKLKLDTLAGGPTFWSDYISMFQSIIDDADISSNSKMHHLQNAVTGSGRAKDAIHGYCPGKSFVLISTVSCSSQTGMVSSSSKSLSLC